MLKVPVQEGSVVLHGETIATIATKTLHPAPATARAPRALYRAGDTMLIGERGLGAVPD